MSRHGHNASKTDRDTVKQIHTPECGKRGYETRSDAKKALRFFRKRNGGKHQRAYRCARCGFWHLGRIGPAVRDGLMTATELYTPSRRRKATA